jgi:hypothetical protein
MTSDYKYATAEISVQNAQPGQRISVTLDIETKSDTLCWSTGDPSEDSNSGITINASGGVALPLNSLSVNGVLIDLQISAGGSDSVTFNISPCLTANGSLSLLKIKSTSDSGPVLTFNFDGKKPITLSQNFVILEWPN